jgi:hypothetical protein
MKTIGTCNECGGPVQVPELWGGSVPPTPTCARCGAIAQNPYGRVIPMTRPRGTQSVADDSRAEYLRTAPPWPLAWKAPAIRIIAEPHQPEEPPAP